MELSRLAALLDRQLDETGLTLLGLAGGSLLTKAKLGKFLAHKPSYIYIDSWEAGAEKLLESEIPLAFHPHAFKPYSTLEELRALFKQYPQLKFLPDTAHLYLLQLNIIDVLEEFKDRIIAIHLKDWHNRHGWSRVMYARGFTELGQGDIKDLPRVREWIEKNFDGYCVIEQDSSDGTPEESLMTSLRWLGSEPPPLKKQILAPVGHRSAANWGEIAVGALRSFRRPLKCVYRDALEQVAQCSGAACVSLWEVNNQTTWMTRESTFCTAAVQIPDENTLQISGTLAGETLKEQAIVLKRFEDGQPSDGSALGSYRPEFVQFIRSNRFREVLSLPLFNVYNPHTVDFVLNLYFREPNQPAAEDLQVLADSLAVIFDAKLNELHSDVFDRFSTIVSEFDHMDDFLIQDAPTLLSPIEARSIYVFLSQLGAGMPVLRLACFRDGAGDITEKQLDPTYSSNFLGDHIVREVFTSRKAKSKFGKFDPINREGNGDQPIIAVPIFAAGLFGVPMGIVVCVGHVRDSRSRFAMHDEIILDAIQVAFGAQLERTADAVRRADSMRLVRHELGNPLGCIVNAMTEYESEKKDFEQRMKRRIKQFRREGGANDLVQILPEDFFQFKPSHPLFQDVAEWVETADSVLQGRGFLTAKGTVEIHPQPVKLLFHIIRPAVKQVLKDVPNKSSSGEVEFGNLSSLPVLMIDKAGFVQVFLNLIRNAVKYRASDSERPSITFAVKHRDLDWLILIEDRGIGVENGYEEEIFKKGVRTPRAISTSATGDGFGLWLVKKILVAHGCDIRLAQNTGPTIFELRIPKMLELKAKLE
jgi:signal transduction histidine kinase